MKEEQLDMFDYSIKLTQDEVNTLELLLGFVANDKICDSIRYKLDKLVEHDIVEEYYPYVVVKEVLMGKRDTPLPEDGLSLYDNNLIIKIND